MAITLQKVSKIDLGGLVNDAIQSIVSVRASAQAKAEADFQKAIAEGTLSYSAQIEFRKKQIENEKNSSFGDTTFLAGLEASLGDLKRLKRFQEIRDKYKASLDSYVAGKGNISQVIDILEDGLSNEQDATIRNELQAQLSSAIKTRSDLEISAITNRATVAERDKSIDLINNSIDEVSDKKARALLADDEDTASMWDATLSSLKATRSTIEIETAVSEINYRINRENLNSGQKLGLISSEIIGADDDTPLVYDGVRYNSMKDFWLQKQGEYIRTSYFEELKNEIDAETARIAAISPFGQVPVERIKAVSDFYNGLKARPDFAPFALEIEQKRVEAVNGLTSELQGALADEAAARVARGENQYAVEASQNKTFQTIESQFGIKLARPATPAENAAGIGLDKTISPALPRADLVGALPTIPGQAPTAPAQMSDADQIAAGYSYSIYDGHKLATSTSSPSPTTPKMTAPASSSTAPKTAATPAAPIIQPASSSSAAKYSGTSIVDYLNSVGQDSSFTARKNLATQNGITNYTGTADQNLSLLGKLNV